MWSPGLGRTIYTADMLRYVNTEHWIDKRTAPRSAVCDDIRQCCAEIILHVFTFILVTVMHIIIEFNQPAFLTIPYPFSPQTHNNRTTLRIDITIKEQMEMFALRVLIYTQFLVLCNFLLIDFDSHTAYLRAPFRVWCTENVKKLKLK